MGTVIGGTCKLLNISPFPVSDMRPPTTNVFAFLDHTHQERLVTIKSSLLGRLNNAAVESAEISVISLMLSAIDAETQHCKTEQYTQATDSNVDSINKFVQTKRCLFETFFKSNSMKNPDILTTIESINAANHQIMLINNALQQQKDSA